MSRAVFLSASVPDDTKSDDESYKSWGVRPRAIDEAVTALTACCLRRKLTLVFGGHPSISPLVALVALQRRGFAPGGEPLIHIYQSEAFRDQLPDETWALFRSGTAKITWTEQVLGDRNRSLHLMRTIMLEQGNPLAMVCIGGMNGVVDEFNMFRYTYPVRRVYALTGTGGAANWLAHEQKDVVFIPDAEAIDVPPDAGDFDAPLPYPYLMDKLTGELEKR